MSDLTRERVLQINGWIKRANFSPHHIGDAELDAYLELAIAALSSQDSVRVPREPTDEMLLAACKAVIPTASKMDIDRVMPVVHKIMLTDGLEHGANADIVAAKIATMIPFYKAMLDAAQDAAPDQPKAAGQASVAVRDVSGRASVAPRTAPAAPNAAPQPEPESAKHLADVSGEAAVAAPVHTDHPLRHWDRTCPACIAEEAHQDEFGTSLSAAPDAMPGDGLEGLHGEYISKEKYDALQARLTAAETDAERLRDQIVGLTHEGRQGELEQANVGLATENERLREGLRFYAHGDHWINELHHDQWDTCSGEPQNWWWRENAEEAAEGIEDGRIAQLYLSGNTADWEGDPPKEHPCELAAIDAARQREGS